jgi:hypothetical protein
MSQGWTAASLGEPGYEERKPLLMDKCCCKKAAAIALQPTPIVDNQAQVNFVQNKRVEVLPNFSQLAL